MGPLAALLLAAGPKILLLYDMEGVSGLDKPEQLSACFDEYAEGRKLLTADVNAAVRGLFAGGAGEVLVLDTHGSGNFDEPDVLAAGLDPRARSLERKEPFWAFDAIDGDFAGVAAVGMHARAGSSGIFAHTFSGITGERLNGDPLSESDVWALAAARKDVPLVMVAGDAVLTEELRARHPDLEVAAVKRGLQMDRAELFAPEVAHAAIEAAARRAAEKVVTKKIAPAPWLRPKAWRWEIEMPSEGSTKYLAGRLKDVEQTGPKLLQARCDSFESCREIADLVVDLVAARIHAITSAVLQRPEHLQARRAIARELNRRWIGDRFTKRPEPHPNARGLFHGVP